MPRLEHGSRCIGISLASQCLGDVRASSPPFELRHGYSTVYFLSCQERALEHTHAHMHARTRMHASTCLSLIPNPWCLGLPLFSAMPEICPTASLTKRNCELSHRCFISLPSFLVCKIRERLARGLVMRFKWVDTQKVLRREMGV